MKTEVVKPNNIWNRKTIKYIAMFTMLLKHIQVFYEAGYCLG